MDLSVLATIAAIFIATLTGAALRARARDRCLKQIDGHHLTLEFKSGELVWGNVHLEPTGLELEYRDDRLDEQQHVETSYVIYRDEYNGIQALYRFVDDLSPEDRLDREAECRRAFHPSLVRRLVRGMRNILNTATDSLTETLNLLLGRTKLMATQTVLSPGQTQIKGLTKDIMGYVGTSFDPMIERFVGLRVVVELLGGDEPLEYVGILKEYSATFLYLLDVWFVEEMALDLSAKRRTIGIQSESEGPPHGGVVWARFANGAIEVKNSRSQPLFVQSIVTEERTLEPAELLLGGESLEYVLPLRANAATVTVRMLHQVDMIMPREHAILRHRTERNVAFSILFGMPLEISSDGKGGCVRSGRAPQPATQRAVAKSLLARPSLPAEDTLLAHILAARRIRVGPK